MLVAITKTAEECGSSWFSVLPMPPIKTRCLKEKSGDSQLQCIQISAEPGNPSYVETLHFVSMKNTCVNVPLFISIYSFLLLSTLQQYLVKIKARRKE